MNRPSLLPPIPRRGSADAVSPLPGWLRRPLARWARATPYSAEEVRRRLRSADSDDPRTAAVQSAASQTAAWSALLSDRAARDLGPAAARLPTVVFWYQHGVEAADIGRRLSPFGGAWDGERAIVTTCRLIARLLNRTRPQSAATGCWTRRNTEER